MSLPNAPNQTIYLQNLNDTVSTNELKRELYCLFSSVAPVVEIKARKGMTTRGQAWISFPNIDAATIAMERFQGFNFLGKDMRIAFAKTSTKSVAEFYAKPKEVEEVPEEKEPEPVPESPILNVTGYPPKANAVVLGIVFRQMPGYQKIEMNGESARVYFDTSEHATEAMNKMQNFPVTESYKLQITHAV